MEYPFKWRGIDVAGLSVGLLLSDSAPEDVARDVGVGLRIVNETFEVDMVVVQVQVQPNLSKQLERVKVAQAFYSDAV